MTIVAVIDNRDKKFSPGQDIGGSVFCYLEEPSVIEVKIVLFGEESTCHTGLTAEQLGKVYNWKRTFLELKDTIIQQEQFTVGDHQFPFKITLPKCIPSSYLGKYGSVTYYLKAYMTVNSSVSEEDNEINFQVFAPIDLKGTNTSLVSSAISDVLLVEKWYCLAEAIHMTVKLERIAFLLGETIDVVVELDNETSFPVSELVVQLFVEIMTKVGASMRILTTNQSLALELIPCLQDCRIKAYLSRLHIPDTADLPNFQKCQFFKLRAFIEVTAVINNLSKPNFKIQTEVFLGHNSLDPIEIPPPPYGCIIDPTINSRISKPSNLPSHVLTLPHAPKNSSITSTEEYRRPTSVPPYPTDASSDLFSNIEELAVPMPPPRQKTSALHPPSERSLPYPRNSCPYPNCPNEGRCPCPTDNSKEGKRFTKFDGNPPYSKTQSVAPPYPKENTPQFAKNQYPPQTEMFKKCQVLRTHDENPYSKNSSIFPPPNEDIPYLDEGTCPYPTDNLKKDEHSTTVSESLPYPKEEPVGTNSSYSNENNCPYPTKVSFGPRSFNPPYHKDKLNLQVHHRINESPASFEKEDLPYPSEAEEQVPLLSHSVQLPSNMPMPSKCIERGTPYSTKDTSFYPTTKDSFTSGHSAPYPLEKSPPYSTSAFMPMPMPSTNSSITCNTIGFAVPTSQTLNVSQSKRTLEAHVEPSAPLFSDIKTPPIATVEELDDLLLTTATSTDDLSTISVLQLPTVPSTNIEISEQPTYIETDVSSTVVPTANIEISEQPTHVETDFSSTDVPTANIEISEQPTYAESDFSSTVDCSYE